MTPTSLLAVYQPCTTNLCPHCAAGCPVPPPEVADGSVDGLWELDADVRQTLPPQFHQPFFDGLGTPNAWLCTACWDEGQTTQWPCHVACAHGADVARAIGVGWAR